MRFTFAFAVFVGLAACGSGAPDDGVVSGSGTQDRALPGPSETIAGGGLADIELCDAEVYRPLVGQDAAQQVFPAGPRLRVYGINDIVTQDYVPQRTNIVSDEAGKITRVFCG